MAIMHPIDIENYDYTGSERRLYYEFKKQLPDKFHVFYSIRWFETSDNKRLDSECDFLVFDPNFGFITIEVKGGIGIDIQDQQWLLSEKDKDGTIIIRALKVSPFVQAEKSMRHFYKYFYDEFNQSFNGVYGFAVSIPNYIIPEKISHEAPNDLVIDLSDMQNLHSKINSIFHYWRNERNLRVPFSQDQKTRFINCINKRIALSAAAGALIPIKEREFAHLNIVQDSIIDALFNYKQAFIIGGAGTGKTWMGMKKVIRAARQDKHALFVCNSAELAIFIKNKLPKDLLIDCCTLEQLMRKALNNEFDDLPEDETGQKLFFDAITSKRVDIMYDTIVVDEAQDFTIDMALSMRSFMKDQTQSELYVLFDKNQNILCRDFEDGFSIDNPPFILRYNIRNTGSIYDWAKINTGLGMETVANTLHGITPEYNEFHSPKQAKKQLNSVINRLIQKEYVPNNSIVILSDVAYDKSILANDDQVGAYKIANKPIGLIEDGEVCFRTTEDIKGLEADIVLFLKHTKKNLPEDENYRQNNYVAYTRARYYLYIFNLILD